MSKFNQKYRPQPFICGVIFHIECVQSNLNGCCHKPHLISNKKNCFPSNVNVDHLHLYPFMTYTFQHLICDIYSFFDVIIMLGEPRSIKNTILKVVPNRPRHYSNSLIFYRQIQFNNQSS